MKKWKMGVREKVGEDFKAVSACYLVALCALSVCVVLILSCCAAGSLSGELREQ